MFLSYNKSSKGVDLTIINTKNQITIGRDNAPIKMYYYFRFSCEECVEFSNETKDVIQKYIDEGKMQLILKVTRLNELLLIDNKTINALKELDKYYTDVIEIEDISSKQLESRHSHSELEYLKSLHKEILEEIETLKIDVVPTFYLNDNRYVGVYNKKEFISLIETNLKNIK